MCYIDTGYLSIEDQTDGTVLPAESDSGAMLCSQSYKGLKIDISLVY